MAAKVNIKDIKGKKGIKGKEAEKVKGGLLVMNGKTSRTIIVQSPTTTKGFTPETF